MKYRPSGLLLFLFISYFFIPAVSVAQAPARVTVVIEPVFNGHPLKLRKQYYVNAHDDTLYIDVFKFYISNLKLAAGGAFISYPDSHLINADSATTLTFHIDNVPAGSFTSLQFTAGVDSALNTSGAIYGDLSPAKGMYWSHDKGYIMAKLEGHTKVRKAQHHNFKFHIGGYMPPYNAARIVNVNVPHTMEVQNGKDLVIRVRADVATWFNGIDLSKTNNIQIPGAEAAMMADNYAKMFSVADISYK